MIFRVREEKTVNSESSSRKATKGEIIAAIQAYANEAVPQSKTLG